MGEQSKLYIAEVNEKLGAVKTASTGLTSASDGYTNEWIAVWTSGMPISRGRGYRDRLEKLMKSVVSGESKTLDALKEADSSLKKFESLPHPQGQRMKSSAQKIIGFVSAVRDGCSRAEFVKLKKEIDLKLVATLTKGVL